ncbi:MAG: hypothetical protein IPL07_15955 [Acidimicrobiaceae bacterium]|nr:hypothetical protein [Acidimicrobiaceae bacterium]
MSAGSKMVPGAAGAVELVGASAVESGAVVSGGAAPTVTLGSVMLVARVVAAPSLPHAETSTRAMLSASGATLAAGSCRCIIGEQRRAALIR